MIKRHFFQQGKEVFDKNDYLTIEPLVNEFTFTFSDTLEYNINGEGWNTLAANKYLPYIRSGDFVSLRANLLPINRYGIGNFVIKNYNKCKISGNCMSLLFGDKAYAKNNLKGYAYALSGLFSGCEGIVEVDSGLLPATDLEYNCYSGMFYNCASLVNAPDLPATVLVEDCYSDMFYGCSSLNHIKMLATDISAGGCLYNWVQGVSPTGTFVKHPEATWGVRGDSGVPNDWTIKFDGEEGVYIEDIDGYRYTEEEWDGSKVPNGIAVLTDNCSFVMALQDAHTSYCQWGSYETKVTGILTTTDKSTAKTDYRGNENTTAILNQLGNSSSTSDAPAAYYCRAFTFPNGKKGYLGSAGEWQAALNNKNAIVSALSKCGGTAMSDYYWASTQSSSNDSWYMNWNNEYLDDYRKNLSHYVRAFTTLKSDGE